MLEQLKQLALDLGVEATVEVVHAITELVNAEADLLQAIQRLEMARKLGQPGEIRKREGTVQICRACVDLAKQAIGRVVPDLANERAVELVVSAAGFAAKLLK